jgi:hypothetical protein
MDLGSSCSVTAIQINFADQGSTTLGRLPKGDVYKYYVEVAPDAEEVVRSDRSSSSSSSGGSGSISDAIDLTWTKLPELDRTANERDMPHDYVELVGGGMGNAMMTGPSTSSTSSRTFRHLRLSCVDTAGESKFSVSGLRVFGACPSVKVPSAVNPSSVVVVRNSTDPRQAVVTWGAARGAVMYVVRYRVRAAGREQSGTAHPLYHSYQVYGATTYHLSSLAANVQYDFAVDAANQNGMATMASTISSTMNSTTSSPREKSVLGPGAE